MESNFPKSETAIAAQYTPRKLNLVNVFKLVSK